MNNFVLAEPPYDDEESARVVVLPVPWEKTVSYGSGTAQGPAALLEASTYVELWDEEIRQEPFRLGIATLPPFPGEALDLEEGLEVLERQCVELFRRDKFPLLLGGEHSLSIAPIRAAAAVFGEIGVVQFDAHCDLRDSYEGSRHSHASVMKRVLDLQIPHVAIGVRSLSAEEADLIEEREVPVLWAYEMESATRDLAPLLAQLPERVYLTFDVDYFDPAIMPATGTPEPGGGFWWPTLTLLRQIFRYKTVLGMDVVELAPMAGQPASDFLAARLAYKAVAYLFEKEGYGLPPT